MVDKKATTRKKTGSRKPSGKPSVKKAKKTTARSQDKQTGKNYNIDHGTGREASGKIVLDESLTISTAENLKEMLCEYSARYRTIELDGTSVELVDTAALQILTSFIMQSERDSVEIRWLGKSDVLEKTAALLGLTGHLKM